MIKCGLKEVIITPPFGNSIPGYFHDRKSTGILDELYAKALAVESGGSTVVFVVLDCITLFRPIVDRIRRRIHDFTGIRESDVMVSATHTHTGPPVSNFTFLQANEDYLILMADKAADAAIMAYNERKEARIGFGSGHEGDIAFNRRFFMKDGTVRTNPGVGNPQIERVAGPIDPQVSVLRLDDLNGEPIGVVTNYACHTDVVGGTEYSADYPGELSAVLKKVLGPQVVSLFLMGASGNINHIDFLHGLAEDYAKPSRHHLKMGRILAGEVLKTREKIRTSPDSIRVGASQVFFPVDYRKPTEEDIQAARHTLRTESPEHVECAFANELLAAAESNESHADVEIQVIRLGEHAVVGLPAEIFVEFGLEIKEKSPFRMTMINELCNGSANAYVCTSEAYRQGGYEPRITSNNKLAKEAGSLFVQHALDLLHELDK